jgi:hypothetical protein
MSAGLTIVVAGLFMLDRDFGIVVSLLGVCVMMGGVALTTRAQGSEVGPGN